MSLRYQTIQNVGYANNMKNLLDTFFVNVQLVGHFGGNLCHGGKKSQ